MAAQMTRVAAALPWLRLQRGDLYQWKDDANFWTSYEAAVFETFDTFGDFLPANLDRVLDIGGGMGGVNIHIANAFRPPFQATPPAFVIVDGLDAPATVFLHREPFNNAAAGIAFLNANGVERVEYVAPSAATAARVGPVGLITSFQAWPFHVPLDEYLNLARRALAPGGLMVVDVRTRDRADRDALERAFEYVSTVHVAPKFERVIYAKPA